MKGIRIEFDFDEDEEKVTYTCKCHEDFEMTIDDCDIKGNVPIEDIDDLEDVLNGLDYNDLVEMHDIFSEEED